MQTDGGAGPQDRRRTERNRQFLMTQNMIVELTKAGAENVMKNVLDACKKWSRSCEIFCKRAACQ